MIEAPRQEIEDFIRLRSSTLKEIELEDMRFVNTCWHAFIPQLRKIAKKMLLEYIVLMGLVEGETEDDNAIRAGFIEERYGFGNPT